MTRYFALAALWLVSWNAVAQEAPAADPQAQAAAPASAPLQTTTKVSEVVIAHVHTVFERAGSDMNVTQTLRLSMPAGKVFKSADGYPVALPKHATAPRPVGEDKEPFQVHHDKIIYLRPIGAAGGEVTIAYKLPIRNGSIELEQSFGQPVGSAQLISTWTKGEPRLTGEGFGESRLLELNSGMMALVMNGGELTAGDLSIRFDGLEPAQGARARLLAMMLSFLLLGVGLIYWVRDYLRGR